MEKETIHCNALKYSLRGRAASALLYGNIGPVIGILFQENISSLSIYLFLLCVIVGFLFPTQLFYRFGLMHPTTKEINNYSHKIIASIENTIKKNNKRVSSINSHNDRLREIKTRIILEQELP